MPFFQTGGGNIYSTSQIADNIVTDPKVAGRVCLIQTFSVNTDSNGQATVTLAYTPSSFTYGAVCITANRMVSAHSIAGAALTLTFRKMSYDRATVTATGTTLSSMPSGVTSDSTTGGPTFSSGAPSSAGTNIYAVGGVNLGAAHTHDTQINKVITHAHDITVTQTDTDLPLATSEALRVTVFYNKVT